ncbi:MAG: maleylacetoacetate isomerase [Rhizobiaceae bacterium]|nr:maleylacetoacetate isomerase [Rhizobiaceae bacterium]
MTDAAKPKLYAYWRTSATYRIRVALALKGLGVEEIEVNLDKGEQYEPAFQAINPQGALPTYVEPGHAPMTQSMAILEYLEERHPEPALLPRDLFERARVRAIAAQMTSDTHPLIVPRVKKYLIGEAGFDDSTWRAWQIRWFTRGLTALEAQLSGDPATGAFCHGETPTIADICLCSITAVARVFKIEVAAIPTIDRIVATCEALDAFAGADPMRQRGAPA